MVKDGQLTAAERAKYTDSSRCRRSRRRTPQLSGQIGYLVDLAKANFLNNNDQTIDADELAQGGYEIHTTFDKEKVDELEDGGQEGPQGRTSTRRSARTTDTHVQFGGASVDPKTGAIVAIYGGEDATKHFTNNADHDRCPGRLDLQAVRAGRGDAVTACATPSWRDDQGRTSAPRSRRQERLQRQEQAEDQELRRRRLDGRERQGVAARPTTATSRTGDIDLREAMQ